MEGWKGDSRNSFSGRTSPFWGECWKGIEGETGDEESLGVRKAVRSGKPGYATGGNGLEEKEKGKGKKGEGRHE
jgi:hypothetical protein